MSEHLTTDSAEKARQLEADYGIDKALKMAQSACRWLSYGRGVVMGLKRELIIEGESENLGFWQEVKQAIEFKKKEDDRKGER